MIHVFGIVVVSFPSLLLLQQELTARPKAKIYSTVTSCVERCKTFIKRWFSARFFSIIIADGFFGRHYFLFLVSPSIQTLAENLLSFFLTQIRSSSTYKPLSLALSSSPAPAPPLLMRLQYRTLDMSKSYVHLRLRAQKIPCKGKHTRSKFQ